MKTKLPFVGPAYTARSLNADAQRSVLKRIARMKHALACNVFNLSIIGCCVIAAQNLSVKLNRRDPSSPFAVYAKNPALALALCRPEILQVNGSRNVSQVAKGVVRPIPIFVVDVVLRPIASHVKPCQPMASIGLGLESYLEIPQRIKASSDCADRCGPVSASLNDPRKNAGFWVVVKKLAQHLRGKIGLSHDAVLSLIGQKPACVDSTSGLRYFNGLAE